METNKTTFDLASFKRATAKMITTNDAAYGGLSSDRNRRSRLKDYTPEEIDRIINSGSLIEQQKLSRNYFYKDGFYKRILIHYATLLKYMGILIPNPSFGKNLSTDHIKKKYYSALDFVEKVNIPLMFGNCSIRALIDGCYYGIIIELDKNNFAMLDLPSGYCCSNLKDIYGNDVIEFDVTYFSTIYDLERRKEALKLYPKVISSAYTKWTNGKLKSKWVIIPSDIGVCFPIFDGRPLFLNVIPATIEYENAVETERERDLEEIRKIIVQQIPHLTDGGLLFEPEEAEEIHNGTVGMLKGNKNVSVLTTYADVDSITSKTSADTVSNNLEKMVQNIYYEGGTSSEIFAAKGSSSLATSLKNDLALMMVLANKYSNFLTNIVNSLYSNTNVNFKYNILPISWYNDKEYIENSFKLAGMGYSFLLPSLAMGLTQRDLESVKSLENDVLKLGEKLIPLSSAYNQAQAQVDANPVGAPPKEEEIKSDKTKANEESIDKTGQGGSE